MKRCLSFLLAAVMLLGMAGCAVKPKNDPFGGAYDNRSREFTICYYEGGYGVEWLHAVAKDYMDNVNKDVKINFKSSTDNGATRDKISGQVDEYDLYFIEVDMFDRSGVLEDLSGLMDMEVPGEAGVKVRDKIGQRWVDYYTEDGKIYQMPATNMLGWNWTYNKTLLDAKLGEGNYQLPKTTDEFLAMGDLLFSKDVFLTGFAGDDPTGGADYLRYCYEVWFAQMTGLEGYNNYFACLYDNGGTYELATDAPKNVEQNKNAIEKTYSLVQTLCQSRKGVEYMHAKSLSMNFIDCQYLLNQGTLKGTQEAPIAFYYNIAAAEREMAPHVEGGIIPQQDIRMMKMPVISAIIERTPSIPDDATLSAVIDYVDGNAAALPQGVTEADAAIVKEARNMMAELVCREFVVTKKAQNKDDIKQFLAYLTSDRAQLVAAQQCNGLPVLNYGYKPTEAELGFQYSTFTKSVYEVIDDAVIVDIAKFDKPAGRTMGMNWYLDTTVSGGSLTSNLFTHQALPADQIYQSTYNGLAGTWVERMKLYLAGQ